MYFIDKLGEKMKRQERSFEMARRLKALRNAKGLSHNDLKNELQSRYGIQISRASLLNYEIDDEFHSKADALSNLKMNAEYLNCFADFYGVSTDYLLCRTDISASDVSVVSACEKLGLSEATCTWLSELDLEPSIKPEVLKGLNLLCEDDLFEDLCLKLNALSAERSEIRRLDAQESELGTEESRAARRLLHDLNDMVRDKTDDKCCVVSRGDWLYMFRTHIEHEFALLLDSLEFKER